MIGWLKRKLMYKRSLAVKRLLNIENGDAVIFLRWAKEFSGVDHVFSKDPIELARNVGRAEFYNEVMKYTSFSNEQLAYLNESENNA